jgi:hypothetical protein
MSGCTQELANRVLGSSVKPLRFRLCRNFCDERGFVRRSACYSPKGIKVT